MPSKKKKYNARFPAGRIKKIMQTDEEVGKVAQAVPIIISRTLELFVESLLTKSMQITQARSAKTLTPSHMKQCILSESRFDFLKDLVKNIPDASVQEDNENNAIFEDIAECKVEDASKEESDDSEKLKVEEDVAVNYRTSQTDTNIYSQQSTSTSRTPVIQYGPKIIEAETTRLNFSVDRLLGHEDESKLHITIASENLPVPQLVPASKSASSLPSRVVPSGNVPPLVPFSHFSPNTSDNLCIDEDYDN